MACQPVQIGLGYRLGRRRHRFEFYDGLARLLHQQANRALLADDHEALSLSGARQANIEAHNFQRHRIVIGRDQCRCQLQAVGSAQGMSAKQALGSSTDRVGRHDFVPALRERMRSRQCSGNFIGGE